MINTKTDLSKDEVIGIINELDEYTGQTDSRKNMRQNNLWHRTTNILVTNQHNEYLVSKRSSAKDYCPGFYDLCFGGVVSSTEMDQMDASAKREAQEEMGLPNLTAIDPKIDQKNMLIDQAAISNLRLWEDRGSLAPQY